MDSSKSGKWSYQLKRGFQWGLGLCGVAFLGIFLVKCGPAVGKNAGHIMGEVGNVKEHLKPEGWINKTVAAIHSVQTKVEKLKVSEEDNHRLVAENARLKVQLGEAHHDCALKSADSITRKYQFKLTKETGNRVGRTLAGLNYRIPEHLSPLQLYSLGIQALKLREEEKVAAIFTTLTGLEDSNTYKTIENYLTTGVAWYRLDNFFLADFYFDEVLKQPESEEILQYQAQARLWKALTAKMLKREDKTRFWLRELVDHHPHSVEAGWVNASEEEGDDSSEN